MITKIQYMVSFALEFVAIPGRVLIVHKIHSLIWVMQRVVKSREVIL